MGGPTCWQRQSKRYGMPTESYFKVDKMAALFQMKGIPRDLNKERKNITKYYNPFVKYRQQLDLYEKHQRTNNNDAAPIGRLWKRRGSTTSCKALTQHMRQPRGGLWPNTNCHH